MPKLELSDEQIVELILQLPPERQRAVLQMLSAARDAWWQRVLAEGEQQMRRLCAERGLNWDAMTEEEREAFVDDLIHEYRACALHS
jgi:TRAP-type C4-dicarboxylate transport system substrate-binding protein